MVHEFTRKTLDWANFIDFLTKEYHRQTGKDPEESEINSWNKSLYILANQILNDHRFETAYIFVEFQIPYYSGRVDALIIGQGKDGKNYGIIIENKQWSFIKDRNPGIDLVRIPWGPYKSKDVPHPTAQLREYHLHFKDFFKPFSTGEIKLKCCSFLHNLETNDHYEKLLDESRFINPKQYPIFNKDMQSNFQNFLEQYTGAGNGETLALAIINGEYHPSKKLLDRLNQTIKNKKEWKLLDTQLVAYNKVITSVANIVQKSDAKKSVIVIRGGPGTGKTVLAVQLLAYAAEKGWKVHFAIGNKSFQQNLKAITQRISDLKFTSSSNRRILVKSIFKADYDIAKRGSLKALETGIDTEGKSDYNNIRFVSYKAAEQIGRKIVYRGDGKENELDLLICDEAHRIWSFNQTRQGYIWRQCSDDPMVQEMIRVAKISVFLLDDFQSVRADEVGTADYIKIQAQVITGNEPEFVELTEQFRCYGSNSYVDFINHCLNFAPDNSLAWKENKEYKFEIFESMPKMYEKLKNLCLENYKTRLVSGYCWKWTKDRSNEIVDKRFNGWTGTWYRPPEERDKEIESTYYEWINFEDLDSYKPGKFNDLVGTVYLVQGFEFDYVGVIFGEDLVIRDGQWVYQKEKSKDDVLKRQLKENVKAATEKLRNVYRILLTRGMRGTYLFFLDKETKEYFEKKLT